jgi:hypothetical protein
MRQHQQQQHHHHFIIKVINFWNVLNIPALEGHNQLLRDNEISVTPLLSKNRLK